MIEQLYTSGFLERLLSEEVGRHTPIALSLTVDEDKLADVTRYHFRLWIGTDNLGLTYCYDNYERIDTGLFIETFKRDLYPYFRKNILIGYYQKCIEENVDNEDVLIQLALMFGTP